MSNIEESKKIVITGRNILKEAKNDMDFQMDIK